MENPRPRPDRLAEKLRAIVAGIHLEDIVTSYYCPIGLPGTVRDKGIKGKSSSGKARD